jgi:hypothetical protein
MLDNIEFYWDEQTQHGHYVYENTYTGELTQHARFQPFPDAKGVWWLDNQDPRSKYFEELKTYLKTQDPYADGFRNS